MIDLSGSFINGQDHPNVVFPAQLYFLQLKLIRVFARELCRYGGQIAADDLAVYLQLLRYLHRDRFQIELKFLEFAVRQAFDRRPQICQKYRLAEFLFAKIFDRTFLPYLPGEFGWILDRRTFRSAATGFRLCPAARLIRFS